MPLPEDPNRPEDPRRGVSAMVRTVGYLVDEFNLELTFFGREALGYPGTKKAILEGRHLIYEVILDQGWIFVKGQGMDAPQAETLCHLADNAASWEAVRFIISVLETNEIRDVSRALRPLQIGPVGPHGLVIA